MAARMGKPLMPWQRYVADVALELDADGRFAYSGVVVTVPRQSGKTLLYSAAMEHRAMSTERGRVWFTMQTGKDAVDWLLNEHVPLLGAIERAGLVHMRRAQGSEHVRWANSGGLVRPFSPQPDALHSKTSDLVVIDEAWAFDLVRGRALDQAIVPTQATKASAQVWKLSTAGTDNSQWFEQTVKAGRAAVENDRRDGTAFFEWACPPDLDPCEPSSWPLFHPAYGLTIHERNMRAALDQFGAEEFARAYGNQWPSASSRVIPGELWAAACVLGQPRPQPTEAAFGFDVAVNRADGAIVAAWRDAAGVGHIEVADYRGAAGWLAESLADMSARWRPRAIGFDTVGPAGDVADEASRGGLELTGTKTREYTAACAAFLEQLRAGRLVITQHPALDDAAGAATQRPLGDAWAWGRRLSSVSLAALTAATVALWAYDHAPAPLRPFRIM